MLRISSTSYGSLHANHHKRLTERLARWLRGVSPRAAAEGNAALTSFVTQTIAFADTYGIAEEDALRSLLQLRLQPNFPEQPTPEHQAVLTRPGFSALERVTAFGRLLSAAPKLRRVTLDMDFAAERRRHG
ncbi:MAG: hypothetical protein H0T76_18895 [Nannocystis sp.]|nr:hypothetical protein [Nannocystis sp.]MBA3548556.1 hypothetical protein [Nannocystis sp.]